MAGSVESSARDVPGRDGVGDDQSRRHFNFQVHVRRTIVGANGVIRIRSVACSEPERAKREPERAKRARF